MKEHIRWTRNRREFLTDAFCGFGSLAFAQMTAQAAAKNPLAPKPPHMPDKAKAKAVIFLFQAGGPSHMETFDPKPLLNQLSGQPRPAEFGEAKYQFVSKTAKLLGTKRTFQRYGKSGIEVSDLFPHQGSIVDELAIIRSCHGDMVVHSAAQYQLMTGRILPGFPNMGSWVAYGLGTESESLPAYCVLPDPKGALEAGQPMYTQGFLPAVYQPTMLRPGARPVLNLELPEGITTPQRRRTLDLLRSLNEAEMKPGDAELEARISAYDLAFKMQTEAPEAFDIAKESDAMRELYGIGKKETDDYGRRCLLARRLVERGVRFVTVRGGRWPRQHAVGRALEHRREPHPHGGSHGPAGGGADQGFEAAGPARFDASGVGRRVRPVAGVGRDAGPGPSQSGLYDVDGGRRDQGRPSGRRHGRDWPAGD
jgi:hypothetical protein